MSIYCIDDVILIWRKVLMKITGLPSEKVLNGESIRGAELATIKNSQKIPIGYNDSAIVFYCNQINDISVVDNTEDNNQTCQAYELHLIIYGNQCKKVSQEIKSNLYSTKILEWLRASGIGLLTIPYIQNTSTFLNGNTYVLRNDISVNFDCVFEDDRTIKEKNINSVEISSEEY